MKHDITLYPPVISLCNVLSNKGCNVVYIGACTSYNIQERFAKKNIVMHVLPFYGGNKLKRFVQQLKFKTNVKKILNGKYKNVNKILWLVHFETALLFLNEIKKYKTIIHLLEFRTPYLNLGYKLITLFRNVNIAFNSANKIVCCEYNRAQITKNIFNLKKMPIVLPNKPYDEELIIEDLSQDISMIVNKYKSKKIILYQGTFQPERDLVGYIQAMQLLTKDFVLFLMGTPNQYYNRLKKDYESEKVIFLPFILPPNHLFVTRMAYIGILSYIPQPNSLSSIINALYCAPNKLFEYSKFSIPMIANDVPSLKFAFTQNKAGVIVNEMNPNEIVKAIQCISDNYEQYAFESDMLYKSVDIKIIINSIMEKI
jgi:glycosyltransferase involved in cell wall biosynthesis